jgi:serine/threonine protein kinase
VPKRIGRYEVRRQLGIGAFGAVYEGWDLQLERRVAIKVPRVDHPDLFIQEARRVAQLDHPHIIPVYDIVDDGESEPFIVSKLIEGTDLKQARISGQISYHVAARIVAKIATALHHAHQQGIIHRDVKPTNILIGINGEPYLADFGIAIEGSDRSNDLALVGSAAYMSPEQASIRADLVDGRSDVFALGIVFYELLTGVRPFVGDTEQETLTQIRSVPAIPPRQRNHLIPKAFETICLRCLETSISNRYTTAQDLADDLFDSLTYNPTPIDISQVVLPDGLGKLVDRLAENIHDVWAQKRIRDGWQFGQSRDDRSKTHPCLVPYEVLPESEKAYDRDMLLNAFSALFALGFQVLPSDKNESS